MKPNIQRASIGGYTTGELKFLGDAQFNKQLQCAVDRGMTGPMGLGMEGSKQILDINLAVESDEVLKDNMSLPARFESFTSPLNISFASCITQSSDYVGIQTKHKSQ